MASVFVPLPRGVHETAGVMRSSRVPPPPPRGVDVVAAGGDRHSAYHLWFVGATASSNISNATDNRTRGPGREQPLEPEASYQFSSSVTLPKQTRGWVRSLIKRDRPYPSGLSTRHLHTCIQQKMSKLLLDKGNFFYKHAFRTSYFQGRHLGKF